MRWRSIRRIVGLSTLGLLGGAVAGVAATSLVTIATAGSGGAAGAVFEVTHLPPLLTVAGERDELVFETHCAPAGIEDPEEGCDIAGTLFAREAGRGAYIEVPLQAGAPTDRTFVGEVPQSLQRAVAVEYYAVFDSADVGTSVTVPPGGASAPSITRRLASATTVALGRHTFGDARRAGDRAVFVPWGEGPAEAGLEPGRALDPIGASAFDVDASGSILLLDHARRRVLRWTNGAARPERVPVSINGTLADLAVASDGSFYVLETTARDGRAPLIRRFDDAGRELEAVEAAERSPAQIRMASTGPIVLQRPSHQWMPVLVGGIPAPPALQRRNGRMSRSLRSGSEVVALRRANELRVALLSGNRVVHAWRMTSQTPLGEIQLAEPVGGQFLIVVRVYDQGTDEFAVLMLDRRGLVSATTLAAADWAEAAPLGRFRLVGRTLYRLGSSPAGVFVDRFDLEVRS